MMGFIIFIALVFGFYKCIYKKWNCLAKFTFKSVMIYITLGMTVLMIFAVVGMVKEAVESINADTPEYRLARVQTAEGYADLKQLADLMVLYEDYEPEFEYAWERVTMNEVFNRYLIFLSAKEAGLGEEYEEMEEYYRAELLKLCQSPAYAQNIPYAQDFLQRAGLLSD